MIGSRLVRMRNSGMRYGIVTLLATCLAGWPLRSEGHPGPGQRKGTTDPGEGIGEPLAIEYLSIEELRRAVRFYRPAELGANPALLIALHGSGGDGERLRFLTDRAFERVADKNGFLVAYPDGLGGHWNGCRAAAPYHGALAGIDDIAFLHAIQQRAGEMVEGELAGTFVVGYSNGGHLVFRLALEDPDEFNALAVIAAHLPVPEERDCISSGKPVSILLLSGTEDPINPWAGGEVHPPGGGSPGHVLSAQATADYFRILAGARNPPDIEHHSDQNSEDSVQLETRHWHHAGVDVALLIMYGGGHTLPSLSARFPERLTGRTSRDIDGAGLIWDFFADHLR